MKHTHLDYPNCGKKKNTSKIMIMILPLKWVGSNILLL